MDLCVRVCVYTVLVVYLLHYLFGGRGLEDRRWGEWRWWGGHVVQAAGEAEIRAWTEGGGHLQAVRGGGSFQKTLGL